MYEGMAPTIGIIINIREVSVIPPDIPDALIGFGANEEGWDFALPTRSKNPNVGGAQAVAEGDNDRIENVEALIVEVLPAWNMKGACARDVIPGYMRVVGVWIAGNPLGSFCCTSACRTSSSVGHSTERVY
jgi:hypothetical protein